MKIINCGIVIYFITAHHIARIERKTLDNEPAWFLFYDNEPGEIVQGPNAARAAYELARQEVKYREYYI